MSKMLRNALSNCFHLRLCSLPESMRPLHISLALLQYALAPLGCTLNGFEEEALIYKAYSLQKGATAEQAPHACPFFTHELLREELVESLASVCGHLAQGQRNRTCEYRLVAILYDRYNGDQHMRQLQERFDRVFHWIATDAALRQIGNDSGFSLM
jgi:hypothetical protein